MAYTIHVKGLMPEYKFYGVKLNCSCLAELGGKLPSVVDLDEDHVMLALLGRTLWQFTLSWVLTWIMINEIYRLLKLHVYVP